ncbi:MAG: amidohydrolase [Firmicutes bacterium]|nr:amidohydrolase [Bacillota bacterium]
MNPNRYRVIDADGHLIESIPELAEFMDPGIREIALHPGRNRQGVFPSLDGMHYRPPSEDAAIKGRRLVRASSGRAGSAEDYGAFLDQVGIAEAVLFTSEGLSVGFIQLADYAVRLCRAYNDYVAERYRKLDRRLHPMALVPLQNLEAAVAELRRAVLELGLPGAMLPSTGLPLHLGHPYYHPFYAAAADLGAVLAVHGGSNRGVGLDTYQNFFASHVLHHPIPLMVALTGMLFEGVLDRYPVKVAFLEGGVGWVVTLLDRIARDFEIYGPGILRRSLPEYLASGQILIGCEGNDHSLPYLVKEVGIEPFAYSSDYPHEADVLDAQREIGETLESTALSEAQKRALLGENAARFFNLSQNQEEA